MPPSDKSGTPDPQQQKALQAQAKKKLKDALKRAKTQKMWFAFVYKNKMNARLMMGPKRITTKEIEQAKKDTKGVLFASGFTSVGDDDAIVFECLKKPFKTLDKMVKEHAAKFAGVPSLKVQARKTGTPPPKQVDDDEDDDTNSDDPLDGKTLSKLFEEEPSNDPGTLRRLFAKQTATLEKAQQRLKEVLGKKMRTDQPSSAYLPLAKAKNMVNRLQQAYRKQDWDAFDGAAEDVEALLTAAEETATRLALPHGREEGEIPEGETSGEREGTPRGHSGGERGGEEDDDQPGRTPTPSTRSERPSTPSGDERWRKQFERMLAKLKERVAALPEIARAKAQKRIDKLEKLQREENWSEFRRELEKATDDINAQAKLFRAQNKTTRAELADALKDLGKRVAALGKNADPALRKRIQDLYKRLGSPDWLGQHVKIGEEIDRILGLLDGARPEGSEGGEDTDDAEPGETRAPEPRTETVAPEVERARAQKKTALEKVYNEQRTTVTEYGLAAVGPIKANLADQRTRLDKPKWFDEEADIEEAQSDCRVLIFQEEKKQRKLIDDQLDDLAARIAKLPEGSDPAPSQALKQLKQRLDRDGWLKDREAIADTIQEIRTDIGVVALKAEQKKKQELDRTIAKLEKQVQDNLPPQERDFPGVAKLKQLKQRLNRDGWFDDLEAVEALVEETTAAIAKDIEDHLEWQRRSVEEGRL